MMVTSVPSGGYSVTMPRTCTIDVLTKDVHLRGLVPAGRGPRGHPCGVVEDREGPYPFMFGSYLLNLLKKLPR